MSQEAQLLADDAALAIESRRTGLSAAQGRRPKMDEKIRYSVAWIIHVGGSAVVIRYG